MSPGQTGHITGQMGRVPGTDGTHTRGCPAKILYVSPPPPPPNPLALPPPSLSLGGGQGGAKAPFTAKTSPFFGENALILEFRVFFETFLQTGGPKKTLFERLFGDFGPGWPGDSCKWRLGSQVLQTQALEIKT